MSDTAQWIAPDHLFDGQTLHNGKAALVQNGQLTQIDAATNHPTALPIKGTLTPGYIDLQVNGGGDVLLNQTPTASAMAAIAAAHRRFGTVAILPTVITDAPDVLSQAAQAAIAAKGQTGIAGLHIEGPHISTARRGTHAERFVRPMDDSTLQIVAHLRRANIPVMITIAPEAVTTGQISALATVGAIVSLGHSDASAEDTRQALAAGATCFTHLFNAMSPLINREPGMTGAALNSTAYAGMICDGIHVADEVVGMALRARPDPETTFIVSDAMPTVGGSDSFSLYGNELRLQDGKLVNNEGSLAGAHVTMADSVARLVRVQGISAERALRMAISIPARVMGLDHLSTITNRNTDDLLVLDTNMAVQGTLSDLMPVPTPL